MISLNLLINDLIAVENPFSLVAIPDSSVAADLSLILLVHDYLYVSDLHLT